MAEYRTYLKFADGTVIENASAGQAGKVVWLYFRGIPVEDIIQIALNKEMTKTIEFHYSTLFDVFVGYDIFNAVIVFDDFIEVRLNGENISVEKEQTMENN